MFLCFVAMLMSVNVAAEKNYILLYSNRIKA